jgi:hypothetical protein
MSSPPGPTRLGAGRTGSPRVLPLPGPGDSLGGRPLRQPSAEPLGQCDDDALGAADVTEPIAVLVLRQLADEFGAVSAQAWLGAAPRQPFRCLNQAMNKAPAPWPGCDSAFDTQLQVLALIVVGSARSL